jgi:hypothetical protein
MLFMIHAIGAKYVQAKGRGRNLFEETMAQNFDHLL